MNVTVKCMTAFSVLAIACDSEPRGQPARLIDPDTATATSAPADSYTEPPADAASTSADTGAPVDSASPAPDTSASADTSTPVPDVAVDTSPPLPTGTEACGDCDDHGDCAGGICGHYVGAEHVGWCSKTCTSSQDCPDTMDCDGDGHCIPRLMKRCTGHFKSYDVVDGCGHTYQNVPCPDGHSCTVEDGEVLCKQDGADQCAPCYQGSDCASGVCRVYVAGEAGECANHCSTAYDCASPFDSCFDGVCAAWHTMAEVVCSDDGSAILSYNRCGTLAKRQQCQGGDRCRSSGGTKICADPCDHLNGTFCEGGFCMSCFYSFDTASGRCCGQCDSDPDCRYP